jgi:hypothetical protein
VHRDFGETFFVAPSETQHSLGQQWVAIGYISEESFSELTTKIQTTQKHVILFSVKKYN